MMICNECGNELRDTAKFCVQCGTKVDQKTKIQAGESERAENSSTLEMEETNSENSKSQLDTIEFYAFDYFDFIKETLISPSSVFSKEGEIWKFGVTNLIIYSIILAINNYEPFFGAFFGYAILQVIFVGLLFLINKFILKGKDTFLDALGKYGGLISGQMIIFLLMQFVGIDSALGGILFFVTLLNQLLIFNLYVLNSQTTEKKRFDNYYQLLVSYIPLIALTFFLFKDLL